MDNMKESFEEYILTFSNIIKENRELKAKNNELLRKNSQLYDENRKLKYRIYGEKFLEESCF